MPRGQTKVDSYWKALEATLSRFAWATAMGQKRVNVESASGSEFGILKKNIQDIKSYMQ